eukprot:m.57920 g.57920  ORF g.57920 m.57920 type:complete len:1465 (-) comp11141_c0_seq4:185-4579(-)
MVVDVVVGTRLETKMSNHLLFLFVSCYFVQSTSAICDTRVVNVSCANQGLTSLSGLMFNPLTTSIDLSGNPFSEIPDGAFSNMTILKTLLLENTGLTSIDGAFDSWSLNSLEKLSLRGSPIAYLNNSFYRLHNLKSIDLSHIKLVVGPSPSLFDNQRSLQYIYMDSIVDVSVDPDLLEDVSTGLLRVTRFAKEIYGARNGIRTIECGMFDAVADGLRILDLSYNRLTSIAVGLLTLPQLEELYLQGNRIDILLSQSFMFLQSLVYFDLRHNNIGAVEFDMFKASNKSLLTTGNASVALAMENNTMECNFLKSLGISSMWSSCACDGPKSQDTRIGDGFVYCNKMYKNASVVSVKYKSEPTCLNTALVSTLNYTGGTFGLPSGLSCDDICFNMLNMTSPCARANSTVMAACVSECNNQSSYHLTDRLRCCGTKANIPELICQHFDGELPRWWSASGRTAFNFCDEFCDYDRQGLEYFPPNQCEKICNNLQSQCNSSYYNDDCLSDCEDEAYEEPAYILDCCAKENFPPNKCEDEGLGEVGFEDCDDSNYCGSFVDTTDVSCSDVCLNLHSHCSNISLASCFRECVYSDRDKAFECCASFVPSPSLCQTVSRGSGGFSQCHNNDNWCGYLDYYTSDYTYRGDAARTTFPALTGISTRFTTLSSAARTSSPTGPTTNLPVASAGADNTPNLNGTCESVYTNFVANPSDEYGSWGLAVVNRPTQGLLVGAYKYSAGFSEQGKAFLYSKADILPFTTTADWSYTGTSEYLRGERLGGDVSTADLNGDGFDDLIIPGYVWEKDDSTKNAGRVLVFFGSASGFPSSPSWEYRASKDCYFGFSTSNAGDIDGDGDDDLIVGAYKCSDGGKVGGLAYVFDARLPMVPCVDKPGVSCATWVGSAGSAEPDAKYGFSVSGAGDVNSDNFADVCVGSPGFGDSGKVFCYYGSPTGLSASASFEYPISASAVAGLASASLGHAVTRVSDFNGDTVSDVAVGAPGLNRVLVFLGESGVGLSASKLMTVYRPREACDNFGYNIEHAGDVNLDGFQDMFVMDNCGLSLVLGAGSESQVQVSYWHTLETVKSVAPMVYLGMPYFVAGYGDRVEVFPTSFCFGSHDVAANEEHTGPVQNNVVTQPPQAQSPEDLAVKLMLDVLAGPPAATSCLRELATQASSFSNTAPSTFSTTMQSCALLYNNFVRGINVACFPDCPASCNGYLSGPATIMRNSFVSQCDPVIAPMTPAMTKYESCMTSSEATLQQIKVGESIMQMYGLEFVPFFQSGRVDLIRAEAAEECNIPITQQEIDALTPVIKFMNLEAELKLKEECVEARKRKTLSVSECNKLKNSATSYAAFLGSASQLTTTAGLSAGEVECNKKLCSVECEDPCGWDSVTSMCKFGYETSVNEITLRLGDCDGVPATSSSKGLSDTEVYLIVWLVIALLIAGVAFGVMYWRFQRQEALAKDVTMNPAYEEVQQ